MRSLGAAAQAHAYLAGEWDDVQMGMIKEIQGVQDKIKKVLEDIKRRII